MRELDVTDLWRESAAACGLPGVPEGHRLVAPVLCWLDAHLRARRRLACVQALDAAGVRLHLVGLGWEKVEGLQHATVLGVVDHDEIPALVRRSKTVLNVGPPFFNHGWHERIPLAMMHGAVCVTETSDYLSGDATLSSLVPTYDVADLDSIGDVVHAAIADPDRADKTRDAYKTAREHHTWARRGAAILESVEL